MSLLCTFPIVFNVETFVHHNHHTNNNPKHLHAGESATGDSRDRTEALFEVRLLMDLRGLQGVD